ncbi:MAG: helix-turn-helix transcriptional regulator, partial [Limisphaerales bacterium]
NEISKELGISSRQLERMFHAALGLTPKAWMREQRMVRARQLIREGCILKSIALLLGFKRYSHFNTEIQAYYGMSPTRLVSSEKSLCFDSERQFA